MATLTNMLGRGVAQIAHTVMLDVHAREGGPSDSDVRAYFATCGVETQGENLAQRLQAYAAAQHCDPRTALRRSDRGARKLSSLLRARIEHDAPRGRVEVVERDGLVTIVVRFEATRYTRWLRPVVTVNGDDLEREFATHPSERDAGWLQAEERFTDLDLYSADRRFADMQIIVYWAMRTTPQWSTDAVAYTPGISISTAMPGPRIMNVNLSRVETK